MQHMADASVPLCPLQIDIIWRAHPHRPFVYLVWLSGHRTHTIRCDVSVAFRVHCSVTTSQSTRSTGISTFVRSTSKIRLHSTDTSHSSIRYARAFAIPSIYFVQLNDIIEQFGQMHVARCVRHWLEGFRVVFVWTIREWFGAVSLREEMLGIVWFRIRLEKTSA